ncbi:hypothetical protein BDW67DRAFT_111546 [Aspergillus spinulosporus]
MFPLWHFLRPSCSARPFVFSFSSFFTSPPPNECTSRLLSGTGLRTRLPVNDPLQEARHLTPMLHHVLLDEGVWTESGLFPKRVGATYASF